MEEPVPAVEAPAVPKRKGKGKDAPGVQANIVEFWSRELSGAETRWKDYYGQAKRISKIYEAAEKSQNNFNILYSNVETLLPSLYNVTPRPRVGRRYKDDNPLALIAGKVLERALEYHCDTPDPAYEPFDGLMEASVLGALVPGMGLARVKYDVEFTEDTKGDEAVTKAKEEEAAAGPRGQDEQEGDLRDASLVGAEAEGLPIESEVEYEVVCGEMVPYDRVRFGPGNRWTRIPWVAFLHPMTKVDATRSFGRATALKLTYVQASGNKARDDDAVDKSQDREGQPTCNVWEIWHRTTKQVVFVAPTYKDGPLRVVTDPLQLEGFYPCPEPLILFSRVNGFIPKPLYLFYETQAKELNNISARINRLIDMLKIRGFYGAGLSGLAELFSKPEGTMIAAAAQGMQPDQTNPANSIWLVPIEKISAVLQQLYLQRQQVKQVIYEVTGISDIIRGATVASETATAQNLKSQYGTLRMKKMQKRVQLYVRDYLRLVSGVMCRNFSPKTWEAITGVKLPSPQEKQAAQQQLMMSQQPPPGGPPPMPGQPPAPPPQPPQPPDPKLVETVGMPTWDELTAFLKEDLLRNYNIDIETNSTIEPDAVEDQEQIAKLLGAISNMFASMGPVVEKGALPMAGFKAMLLAVCRRFRFGDDVEEILKQIPDQMPQAQDEGKQAETKAKLELVQAETQGKIKVMDKEVEVEQKELELKMRELALKEKELVIKEQELGTKQQASQIKSQGIIAAAQAKTQAAMIAAQAPPPPAPARPAPAPQQPQQPMGGPGAPV